jgi:ankyrin repeat protein
MAGTPGQQLLKAAEQGDVERLRELLAAGAPVNGDPRVAGAPHTYDSPLVRAACFGRTGAAEVLLLAGADVNHRGQYGRTALSYAVTRSLELTRLILAWKPELDGRSDSENSALDDFLFHVSYDGLDVRILDALIDAGVDLTKRGTRYAAHGRSPLALAVSVGHLASVERLLAAGLDPNEGSPPGGQVITELSRVKDSKVQLAILERLVAGGLVPGAASRFMGRSALMLASQVGDVALVTRLLDGGADPNERHDGTALLSACAGGFADVVRVLLERGADPNLGHRGTPLMAAARRGDVEVARLLLDAGADPTVRGDGTALTIAETQGSPALVDLLLVRGAKPEGRTLEAGAAASLEATRAAAERDPESPTARLAWARALQAQGFRAAAFCELEAARRLGAVEPPGLRDALAFENPGGRRWTFLECLPPQVGVAPAVEDARFPGARVASGARVLPLAIALGPACTSCDELGTVECSRCNGRGSYESFLDPDHDVECAPRMPCPHCGGVHKHVVIGKAFGAGPCAHPSWALEWKDHDTTLERCAACGLARLQLEKAKVRALACGVCGHLACVCQR